MVFMIIGSTLAAAAQTWAMLLLGRAFQGLSAAGILNMIKIVLSDKVSLADNARTTPYLPSWRGCHMRLAPSLEGTLPTPTGDTASSFRFRPPSWARSWSSYCCGKSLYMALTMQLVQSGIA